MWIAGNKPYGSIVSYYLVRPIANGEKAHLEILDRAGHMIRQVNGPGAQGINPVVLSLREDPL
ncbi:MAG TPA: hypothetical protein VNE63_17260 [Candidatus Acidoferrales bacterium]|nr:hypothetical protein [Candidatus Acidoferrales bacterium]